MIDKSKLLQDGYVPIVAEKRYWLIVQSSMVVPMA